MSFTIWVYKVALKPCKLSWVMLSLCLNGAIFKNFDWRYSQWKSTLKWDCSPCEKYEYGHLRSWYIKSTLYKRFLNWTKIFKKNELVTGKAPFFVIGLFRTPHSVCLNIGFWQGSFVWKWCVFNLSILN